MTYIIGPCSIESYELFHSIASKLYPLLNGKDWYFKGSFDKANRSSLEGKRGPGLDSSIEIFTQIKKDFPGIRLTTDVHETWQVEKLKDVIDVIQIPAFLCRQTDLLTECASAFDIINIKKGQWMSPQNMIQGVDKIKNTNDQCKVWVSERGSQFGYGQLIVDFGAVDLLSKHFDKVILDCTHSTQRLKETGRTGGSSDLAKKYFKAATIFGYTGIFAETHPNPPEAYSDMDSQIQLDDMIHLLKM